MCKYFSMGHMNLWHANYTSLPPIQCSGYSLAAVLTPCIKVRYRTKTCKDWTRKMTALAFDHIDLAGFYKQPETAPHYLEETGDKCLQECQAGKLLCYIYLHLLYCTLYSDSPLQCNAHQVPVQSIMSNINANHASSILS